MLKPGCCREEEVTIFDKIVAKQVSDFARASASSSLLTHAEV